MRRSLAVLLVFAGLAALLAPVASAKTVGSDLEALDPTVTIACPNDDACVLAQALGGNGTPFSPPTGVITSWSVKLGARAPEGIRLTVQEAAGSAGSRKGRRTIDVGELQVPGPGGVTTFPERLPIHADEVFGVRIEAASRAGTSASIAAPFTDEYKTLLLWDPPPPFGGSDFPLPTRVFQSTRIALSIEVVPPAPGRCDPLNTFTGSRFGDDYGGFGKAGDPINGLGGDDLLRGLSGADCVYGGGGDDEVAGMDGADLLSGGSGRDRIRAGKGNDRILVRDGKRDRVQCAEGRDTVEADRLDRLFECERVRRS